MESTSDEYQSDYLELIDDLNSKQHIKGVFALGMINKRLKTHFKTLTEFDKSLLKGIYTSHKGVLQKMDDIQVNESSSVDIDNKSSISVNHSEEAYSNKTTSK